MLTQDHSLCRFARLVVLFFPCFLALSALAQTLPQLPVVLSQSAETLAQRRAAIRKNSRFLGWKFARLAHQDAKKWQRDKPQGRELSSSARSSGLVHSSSSSPAAGFGNAGFSEHPTLPAGFIPTAIASADFDGDGKLDFAISNGGDNTIYVFLGNGDDTFQVPTILYTQGQSPNWITAVTLRKNGPVDLAVTDGDSNTVEVFLGNGDGTFQPGVQTSLPQIPTFILAADVNNDGNQDLVVGLTIAMDATQPQFEVLLGNGSGGFSGTIFSQAIYGDPDFPVPTTWIAAGDLNNDGYVDFVITFNTEGYFMPYLSQSGQSFPSGGYLGFNDGPMVVGVGDMNEDGCLDAVQFGGLGLLTVANGTCDGNFAQNPNPTAMVGDLDPSIVIADVNGDGHLDVVGGAAFLPLLDNPEAGTEAGYLVSVLLGDGEGDLAVAQTYRSGANIYSLVVADFNGDTYPEILTADSLENKVRLLTNNGSGGYGPPQGATIGYTIGVVDAPDHLAPMEAVDVNGDGKPDLLLVEFASDLSSPAELTALLNDGTGNFLPPIRSSITGDATVPVPVFVAGAFRNPATPDVIYMNTYNEGNSNFNVLFLRGNGDGTFASPVTLATLPFPQQVVAGDFNSDGKLDFAVMGLDSTGTQWEFDVFLGHGDGTFGQLTSQKFPTLSSLGAQQLFALDLNNDGKLDLLAGLNANGGWEASGDDLIEVLGNGDGTFQTPTILISHFGAVAVADVNLDGYPDLIQTRDPNGNFGQVLASQPGVTVYLGSANGTFQQQPSYDLPGVTLPSLNPALVGDFNADGIPDVAMLSWPAQQDEYVDPSLVILQGVGNGTFIVTGHTYQLAAFSQPIIGADFSGDGATDLMELTASTSSYTTIPAAPAPALDITLDSSPVIGATGQAIVTLDLPAASAETVTLSTSDSAITVPASVAFAVGSQTQNVPFTLGPGFDATHVFAIYATLGSQVAVAYGTKPNPNLSVGVTAALYDPALSPDPLADASIEPGESLAIDLTLESEGGYSGTYSSLQCSGLPAGASCAFGVSSLPIIPGGGGVTSVTVNTSTSTPFGTGTVTVSATDGFLPTSASFNLGIGDFSLSIAPTTIVAGPTGNTDATLSSTATNGLNEQLSFVCTGLPAGTQCGPDALFYTSGPSTGFGFSYSQLAASDYPFQITGTADVVSHSVSAVLRVGDFTASLDQVTASLSVGQSATFNVTLTSVNHYASSISVFCDPSANTVTCTVSPLPANLTDDGTATVQLTVTNVSTSPAIRHAGITEATYLVALLVPLSMLVIRRKARPIIALMITIVVIGIVSCGGGGSAGNAGGSGGGGEGGGGAGGTPQTVNVSVVAQAANTQSDMNNQKTVGPIVITLN
jgi:hypothetical protein